MSISKRRIDLSHVIPGERFSEPRDPGDANSLIVEVSRTMQSASLDIREYWFQIDECKDVIYSHTECERALAAVPLDQGAWKWVIISLHSAIQGALVCHLTGTMGIGACEKKFIKKVLQWHEKDRKRVRKVAYIDELGIEHTEGISDYPRERLVEPSILLKRTTGELLMVESAGGIITFSDGQLSSFNKLDELRHALVHYKPSGNSFEMSGMPTIIADITSMVKLIADGGWAFRHLDNGVVEIYGAVERIVTAVPKAMEHTSVS
jgi:hypothetical protein